MITQELLKEILDYDILTGIFTWKIKRSGISKNKTSAGGKDNKGYVIIGYNGKVYKAHRLAWLYVYGYLPDKFIDHINHDPSDNRIENLREVTYLENNKNKPINKNNTSGTVGVNWVKSMQRWRAVIQINGKKIYKGQYKLKEDAIMAIEKARIEYGFHENHGINKI